MATASSSLPGNDVLVTNSKIARRNWKKVNAGMVVQVRISLSYGPGKSIFYLNGMVGTRSKTVVTEQLKLEHTAQVQEKYRFLVKDFQKQYY